ncbi:uncharacterized protein METZ01_LOCUS321113, partial [marine metagenome]
MSVALLMSGGDWALGAAVSEPPGQVVGVVSSELSPGTNVIAGRELARGTGASNNT